MCGDWNVCVYMTGYGGWDEYASIALNGNEIWHTSSNYGPYHRDNHTLTIPSNRTSTAIFISASTGESGTRGLFLAFCGDSLTLPNGLDFVDDLVIAENGWDH